jgi:hypothetical protein
VEVGLTKYKYYSGPIAKMAKEYCVANAGSLTENEWGYIAINNARFKYYLLANFYSTLVKERSRMEKLKVDGNTTRIVLVNPNELFRNTMSEFYSKV